MVTCLINSESVSIVFFFIISVNIDLRDLNPSSVISFLANSYSYLGLSSMSFRMVVSMFDRHFCMAFYHLS